MTLILSGSNGVSDVDGTAATPAIRGTDANTGIFFPAADTIAFAEGGVESMRLDSSGNLGLGVTPSAWSGATALQVGQYTSISGNSSYSGVGTNFFATSAGYATKYINNGYAAFYSQSASSGQHQWYTAPSGTAGNAITFTQAMTLDASGRLGVGTTSPSSPIHVVGNSASNFLLGGIRINDTNTSSDFFIGGATGGGFQIATAGGATRAIIDSSGNLLVGTTSSGTYGGVAATHRVNTGNNSNWSFAVTNTASSGTVYGQTIAYTAQAPNSAGNGFLYCYDNVGARFYVVSNGGIYNYQANNSNLSDRREKTNFEPAGEYLSKICAIPVQTFNYIDQNMAEDPDKTLGVVAQDVQAVAPELVTESNWGTEDNPKMRLSIYQTDLQYALMKCIQEQQAIITALTERVAALEAK